jgi:S1-C subfamily serine protease
MSRGSLILAVAVVGGVQLGALMPDGRLVAHAQSLGDVANKAAEQRKAAPEAAKVYRNADLKPDGRDAEDAGSTPTSGPVPSATPTNARLITTPAREDIVKAVTPAVVTIETNRGIGSGFFVAPGLVLTNKHVIDGASSMRVIFSNGRTSSAYVTSTAGDADLALVKVATPPAPQPTLDLGGASSVQAGEEVLAIGSALGVLQSTVTRGIVSAVRTVGGLTYVQTDAAINPGNSGGPLIDMNGRVIAITTSRFASAESLGFAISIDHAKRLIRGETSVALPDSNTPGQDSTLAAAFNPPATSDTERARERGIEQFTTAVRTFARQADEIDTWWRRYRSGCAGKGSGGAGNGRDWFGVWADPVVLSNESVAECRALLGEVINLSARISAGMQQAGENARRAGVYPGTARDIRRKHAMDWPGWDR